MDGAGPVSRFIHLTLPHMARAITVVILIQTIFLLGVLRNPRHHEWRPRLPLTNRSIPDSSCRAAELRRRRGGGGASSRSFWPTSSPSS